MLTARRVTRFAILVNLLTACGCGSATAPSVSLGPILSAQACRTFATSWIAASTFGVPQNVTASFDTTTRVYTESIAASGLLLRQTTYASTSDFIDEPGVLGRVLYLQDATCSTAAGCSAPLAEIETPTYDSARRRIKSVVGVNGVPLIADTFAQWNPQNLPVAGERAQAGVCVVPLSIVYDAATRTVTETAASGGSILCAVGSTQESRSYDADGNVLSDTASAGGTTTTIAHSIGTTQKLCK